MIPPCFSFVQLYCNKETPPMNPLHTAFLLAAARFTLRLTNLFDVEARNASSFIKDALPLPGRGLEAGLKLSF